MFFKIRSIRVAFIKFDAKTLFAKRKPMKRRSIMIWITNTNRILKKQSRIIRNILCLKIFINYDKNYSCLFLFTATNFVNLNFQTAFVCDFWYIIKMNRLLPLPVKTIMMLKHLKDSIGIMIFWSNAQFFLKRP